MSQVLAGERFAVRVPTLRVGRWSLPVRRRPLVIGGLLVASTVAVGVVSLTTGDYPIALSEVVRTLAGHGSHANQFIVETLRLPRVLVAAMVGLALGMAGSLFQTLTRNPLGSPDILGFSTGAATGALVEMLVIGGGELAVATGSIVGGILTAAVIYLLAYKQGVQGYRLVLVGIGVAAVLLSVNSYLILRARLTDAMAAATWLVGSLNGRSWEQAGPLAVALVVLVPLALLCSRGLGLLEMGDDAAAQLGVAVERNRLGVVLVGVGLTAVAIAAAGPITFVALVAPQLAKRLTRQSGPGLLGAGLMGALLLVASDMAAQRLFAPTQLPVGVMTGVLGGVYLVGLLAFEWRSGRA